MFLLDTNVISELRRAPTGRADAGVIAWLRGEPSDTLYISAVTVFELERGVRQTERRDPTQGAVLRRWLDASLGNGFENRILALDGAIARRAAGLHVPDPAPERDAYIGATGLVHDLTVVTRNVADFERFDGLRVLNPWT